LVKTMTEIDDDTRQCDCRGDFPPMTRIPAPSVDRFYLCSICHTVRVEHAVYNTPGTIGAVTFHALGDDDLPALVRELAGQLLDRDDYDQPELF